jgi:hypothetical protein
MVRSAQTMHLHCVKISTISKWTEMSIQLSHVTLEYHLVYPKWFLNLWYVRRKPCTYLASRLALSPTDRNEHPHEPRHPEYHQVHPKWFLSLWYVWRKLFTFLALTLTMSPNGLKWDSTWPTSPRSSIECVQNDFQAYDMFSANRASLLPQDYHNL